MGKFKYYMQYYSIYYSIYYNTLFFLYFIVLIKQDEKMTWVERDIWYKEDNKEEREYIDGKYTIPAQLVEVK